MVEAPDLGSLRAELRAAGLFEPREGAAWFKLVVLATGLVTCLVALAHTPVWAIPFLIVAAAVCSTSIAMLGHEGSHKAFSKSPARNTLIQYVAFPLFSGLSALYWRDKHDRKHHGHPNVPDLDPDLKPWPFVSCREDLATVGPFRRWIIRTFQSWGMWLWAPLMALGMRRMSLWYLAGHARAHGVDRFWILDVACIAAHYTMWMVVPSLIWGPLIGIGVYSLIWAGVGVMLILVFAPAHIGLPLIVNPRKDWVHQLETTRNLAMPKWLSWFFIGLDYQVEHHMFPKISHPALPEAAVITRRWCEERGLPYKSVPYLYGLADASRFMHRMWKISAIAVEPEPGPEPTSSVIVDLAA
jgi:fatty acid desaturase